MNSSVFHPDEIAKAQATMKASTSVESWNENRAKLIETHGKEFVSIYVDASLIMGEAKKNFIRKPLKPDTNGSHHQA